MMKRDMDLVRELLLAIEDGQSKFVYDKPLDGSSAIPAAVNYHLHLLEEAGFLTCNAKKSDDGTIYVNTITWSGYEFLDTVRDPDVWRKTKAGASEVGSWSIDFIKRLAAAYLKLKAKEKLGIDLG